MFFRFREKRRLPASVGSMIGGLVFRLLFLVIFWLTSFRLSRTCLDLVDTVYDAQRHSLVRLFECSSPQKGLGVQLVGDDKAPKKSGVLEVVDLANMAVRTVDVYERTNEAVISRR